MMDSALSSKEFTFVTVLVLFSTIESYKLENVALDKKAYQSSNHYSDQAYADKAVDGGLSQKFSDGSCTHTKNEANAFWEVDLGKKFQIDHVTLYKRTDVDPYFATRLRHVELYIRLEEHNYTRFGYYDGVMESVHTFYLEKPTFGQWVRITRIPSVVDVLELCEVQVYGYALEWYFSVNLNQKGKDTFFQTSMNSLTITHCAFMCYKRSGCEAANYDEDMKICDLFTSSANEEAVGLSMLIPYR